ncbi:MAG TPA: hypothetical protein VGF14_04750 [Alphaproteobacteria bacterium]
MNNIVDLFKINTDDKTIDLASISFDAFYLFLAENHDFEKGKWAGNLLIKKFKTSFLEPAQEYLPTGIEMNWNLADAKKKAERVFKQDADNRKLYDARTENTSQLTRNIYGYHDAVLRHQEEKRLQSLGSIKGILQPFFTEELYEEPVPKKTNLFQRLFS